MISFGSFGDIVSAADLAVRIAKALSSSSGSSYEYQQLIQELNTLAYVLQLADTATRTGMLQCDVASTIIAEITSCRAVMDRLWVALEGSRDFLQEQPCGELVEEDRVGVVQDARCSGDEVEACDSPSQPDRPHDCVQHVCCPYTVSQAIFSGRTSSNSELNLPGLSGPFASAWTGYTAWSASFRRSWGAHSQMESVIVKDFRWGAHSQMESVIVKDFRGVETMLPMDLCHDAYQICLALNVARKWAPYQKYAVEQQLYCLAWEETKSIWSAHYAANAPALELHNLYDQDSHLVTV
ncbi:hypothetical protein C8Q74DRAFT_1371176 [Fomes fomentarius]|nr:hypothetical protein C8Q74DRAFT_1371176 [Fomes fomentarius]